jgi:hypothetical protein
LVFLVHGLVCFLHPATIGFESGLAMPTPGAIIEVRAEYGGLPMALGLFFVAGAMQRIETRTSLTVMVVVVVGYAVARITAVFIAGGVDTYNLAAIGYEVTTAVLGFWALRLIERGEA